MKPVIAAVLLVLLAWPGDARPNVYTERADSTIHEGITGPATYREGLTDALTYGNGDGWESNQVPYWWASDGLHYVAYNDAGKPYDASCPFPDNRGNNNVPMLTAYRVLDTQYATLAWMQSIVHGPDDWELSCMNDDLTGATPGVLIPQANVGNIRHWCIPYCSGPFQHWHGVGHRGFVGLEQFIQCATLRPLDCTSRDVHLQYSSTNFYGFPDYSGDGTQPIIVDCYFSSCARSGGHRGDNIFWEPAGDSQYYAFTTGATLRLGPDGTPTTLPVPNGSNFVGLNSTSGEYAYTSGSGTVRVLRNGTTIREPYQTTSWLDNDRGFAPAPAPPHADPTRASAEWWLEASPCNTLRDGATYLYKCGNPEVVWDGAQWQSVTDWGCDARPYGVQLAPATYGLLGSTTNCVWIQGTARQLPHAMTPVDTYWTHSLAYNTTTVPGYLYTANEALYWQGRTNNTLTPIVGAVGSAIRAITDYATGETWVVTSHFPNAQPDTRVATDLYLIHGNVATKVGVAPGGPVKGYRTAPGQLTILYANFAITINAGGHVEVAANDSLGAAYGTVRGDVVLTSDGYLTNLDRPELNGYEPDGMHDARSLLRQNSTGILLDSPATGYVNYDAKPHFELRGHYIGGVPDFAGLAIYLDGLQVAHTTATTVSFNVANLGTQASGIHYWTIAALRQNHLHVYQAARSFTLAWMPYTGVLFTNHNGRTALTWMDHGRYAQSSTTESASNGVAQMEGLADAHVFNSPSFYDGWNATATHATYNSDGAAGPNVALVYAAFEQDTWYGLQTRQDRVNNQLWHAKEWVRINNGQPTVIWTVPGDVEGQQDSLIVAEAAPMGPNQWHWVLYPGNYPTTGVAQDQLCTTLCTTIASWNYNWTTQAAYRAPEVVRNIHGDAYTIYDGQLYDVTKDPTTPVARLPVPAGQIIGFQPQMTPDGTLLYDTIDFGGVNNHAFAYRGGTANALPTAAYGIRGMVHNQPHTVVLPTPHLLYDVESRDTVSFPNVGYDAAYGPESYHYDPQDTTITPTSVGTVQECQLDPQGCVSDLEQACPDANDTANPACVVHIEDAPQPRCATPPVPDVSTFTIPFPPQPNVPDASCTLGPHCPIVPPTDVPAAANSLPDCVGRVVVTLTLPAACSIEDQDHDGVPVIHPCLRTYACSSHNCTLQHTTPLGALGDLDDNDPWQTTIRTNTTGARLVERTGIGLDAHNRNATQSEGSFDAGRFWDETKPYAPWALLALLVGGGGYTVWRRRA